MAQLLYRTLLAALLLIVMGAVSAHANENLTITVTGVRAADGQIAIMAFDNQENFDAEKPVARFKFPKTALDGDTIVVRLALNPGTYGLVFLDDENSNETMDKNLLQIPKEGFAFSGFEFDELKKPTFDDFKITVGQEPLELTVALKYL